MVTIFRWCGKFFRWCGKFLYGIFMGLGYLIAVLAGGSGRSDDDEKDAFMQRYDNHQGGVNVDGKNYTHDQADTAYQNGKFYDKYDKY